MKVMTNKMILTIIAVSHVWWLASCVGADPQINLLNEGCSQYNATSLSDFYTNLNATFLDLKAQLLNGSKHFATAQQAKGSDPVYAMTQCRNYLSSADCLSCFAAAVSQIRNCSASNGARVVYDGCFLRYNTGSSCFCQAFTLEQSLVPTILKTNASLLQQMKSRDIMHF